MTCIGQPPATLDAWLALVNSCATAAGGADWVSDAITGAQALALIVVAVLLVGAVAVRLR